MKKSCYEINPERLSSNKSYKNLTLIEKGIYHALLGELWKTDKQYIVDANYKAISANIGCNENELIALVSKLSTNEDALLKMTFDLDDFSDNIVSIELKKQINQFLNDKEIEKNLIKAVRENSQKSEKSLIEKMRTSENLNRTVTIKYLEKDSLDTEVYSGWMPTKNFDSSGQVYALPDEFIEILKKEFPESPIQEYLEIIFNWLIKNNEKRQTIANMNGFIMRWIERSLESSNANTDNMKEVFSKALLTIDIDEEDIDFDFK